MGVTTYEYTPLLCKVLKVNFGRYCWIAQQRRLLFWRNVAAFYNTYLFLEESLVAYVVVVVVCLFVCFEKEINRI